MILDKDSSVLGYPGETSRKLDADHHNICKYNGSDDPNYVTVRNALKSLVSKTSSSSEPETPSKLSRSSSLDLKCLLAVTELPDVDYHFFRDQWAPGTNEWLFKDQRYLDWAHEESVSSLLWLHGGAAAGKSVLSSFVINTLVEQGCSCQYFFVRFGDQSKRSLSLLLRSIAYQVARCEPKFLHKILELIDEAIDFETADPRILWERVFKTILFDMEGVQELYWVIDGLDEADDPQAFIRLLSDIFQSSTHIKVLLVGRPNPEIFHALQRVSKSSDPRWIEIEGREEDIRSYIDQELNMSGAAKVKEQIAERIVARAQDNFLVSTATWRRNRRLV